MGAVMLNKMLTKKIEIICKGHIVPVRENCNHCKRDIDTSHHPNNYDCPYYIAMKVHTFYAQETQLEKFYRRYPDWRVE